jgi:hypothetical protein
MKNIFAFVVLTTFSITTYADIVGQFANYILDKDPNRTSSMIKSGTVKLKVVQQLEQAGKEAFQLDMDYKMNVSLMGNYEGTETRVLEKEFFTPEFLEKLRKEKHYEGEFFKADHKGYADTKTLEGKFYTHCDLVLLYDMKDPGMFAEPLAAAFGVDRADIEDLKALVHVYPGIPVLGGAKVDVSGKSSGMSMKAGGDYVTPN